jgi:hypothetical protein
MDPQDHQADTHDFSIPLRLHGARHPGTSREESRQEMKVKKVLDEISPLVPQIPKEEIKAIIQQHHE